MKTIVFIAMIALSTCAYGMIQSTETTTKYPEWKGFSVKDSAGNPTKYTVMYAGDAVQIYAVHQNGDNDTRITIIQDNESDGVIDRAYRVGDYQGDKKMHYDRVRSVGIQYYPDWAQEWEESNHRIQKLLGMSVKEAITARK